MKLSLFLFSFVFLILSVSLISAETTPVDKDYISKCEPGVGWIFCKLGEIWENWFDKQVIEISTTKPSMNKLGTANVLVGWKVTKQEGNEQNFDVYISNPLNKDTSICLVVKPDATSVDLTAKPIYNQLGAVTDKSVPMTLAYEPAKCIVDGIAVAGYQLVLSDPKLSAIDDYVKIGTNSLVLEYQNDSKIQYIFDWGETNITLFKEGVIDSNIYVYYNNSEGKIDFGATDYSPILKNYTYVLNSTGELVFILQQETITNTTLNTTKIIDYPLLYNYDSMINFQESRQQYSFKGICDKEYSDCSWIDNENSFIINFKSYGNIDTKSITNVTGCGTLSIANEYYIINQTIPSTTTTCFTINADNITLDGNGYSVDGDDSGVDYGIYANKRMNITIKNFKNITDFLYGVYLLSSNTSAIQNITADSNRYGILLSASPYNNLNGINSNSNLFDGVLISGSNYNKLSNINADSNNRSGVFLGNSDSNNVTGIIATLNLETGINIGSSDYNIVSNISTSSSIGGNGVDGTGSGIAMFSSLNNSISNVSSLNNTYYGIYINSAQYNSNSNVFDNIYINSSKTSTRGISVYDRWYISNSNNNLFKNILIEKVNMNNVEVYGSFGGSLNNTFVNVTYNKSLESVLGSTSSLIRKWYYTAYVNDTFGNNVSGANITVYNRTGNYQFNLTTGSNGQTLTSAEIIDYINNAGTRTFYSPYNNTAVKGLPNPTYALKNQTWNVTLQNNTRQDFTLLKSSAPNVTFNTQTPADLNLTNFLGAGGVNITYNISDFYSYLNISTIKLFYKANSTTSNVMFYQNGTAYVGYFHTTYIDNVSSTFRFNLLDNSVLPGTYNYGDFTLENTPHDTNALSNSNRYLSIELLNVSNTQYSFFEVMANSTNIIPVYYCNSSYNFNSNPILNSNCNLVYNIPANNPYDHIHTNYSSHQVIPFTINEATGTFGTIKITSTSYFILRGASTTNFYSIPNLSRTGAMRTSANSGNSWTNQTYTVDAHLHQFNSGTSLWYYACANDTLNNQNCSTPRQDVIQLTGLQPTAPQVYSPAEQGYSGTIPINYTASTPYPPNTISTYNISLMDSSNNYIKNIVNNGVNLGYLWDTSTTANGNYIIRVTACDNTGQCASGYSELFTLSNFPQQQLYILPEEKSFLTTETANVTVRCRMSNGSDCPVQTDCRITSYYPNQTILKNNQFMINSAPIYSYNFGILTTTGAYNSIVFCYNTINGTASFNFDVTKKSTTTGGAGGFGYDNPRLPHLK